MITASGLAPFPHCDSDVLHAPGVCAHCDRYPEAQALRVATGINFTGQHDWYKTLCPSELGRPLELIERWPGNRPTPKVIRRATPDLDVTGVPAPPDGSRHFLFAVVVAAFLTVLVGWLWISQDDINRQRRERQRRERLESIPTLSPIPQTPRFPSEEEPVIAASAAEGEL